VNAWKYFQTKTVAALPILLQCAVYGSAALLAEFIKRHSLKLSSYEALNA